jgi:hypothetical protein
MTQRGHPVRMLEWPLWQRLGRQPLTVYSKRTIAVHLSYGKDPVH